MTDDDLAARAFGRSLCVRCRHRRIITSGRGSQFLLCRAAATEPRLPKYPPQPVGRCIGFEADAASVD